MATSPLIDRVKETPSLAKEIAIRESLENQFDTASQLTTFSLLIYLLASDSLYSDYDTQVWLVTQIVKRYVDSDNNYIRPEIDLYSDDQKVTSQRMALYTLLI